MSQSQHDDKLITVIFFAALREQLNCDKLSLMASEDTNTVAKVKLCLLKHNPAWQDILNKTSLLCAVNHEMSASDDAVKPGDEVAFFPPVTGG